MLNATPVMQRLIDAFATLPGIGRKSAARLAYYLVRQDVSATETLAQALISARRAIKLCETCHNICETSPCEFCTSPKRDDALLCVVESPQDLMAIETTREYHGRYHVLHGVISPLEGIGPRDLKIHELLVRLQQSQFREIILATNPSIEGEATALYIKNLVITTSLRVSRIASGLPMGSQLEFADKVTLGRSLLDRRALS